MILLRAKQRRRNQQLHRRRKRTGMRNARKRGRTPASAYAGARKVIVPHPELKHGDGCPECPKGKVYGQLFTAPEPEGVGPEKYDETASAMVAQLKYGSGVPFNRIENLEKRLGVPLPAATQWEIVEEAAALLEPARDELIRQAAQGELFHNDDTSVRILTMERPEGDQRTGVFTSAVVSVVHEAPGVERRTALYFSGRKHAGENLADVLKQRAAELGPAIQMRNARGTRVSRTVCDALSRNTPKLSEGAELLLANCLAHGRRQFVEVAGSFPDECRHAERTQPCVGDAGRSLRQRCVGQATGSVAGGAAAVSPGAERSGHGGAAGVAERTVIATQSGAEFGIRQGDELLAATLAAADSVPAASGRAAGQQHLRAGVEEGSAPSKERSVLQDDERRAGRRPVHEPDPHLRVEWSELV